MDLCRAEREAGNARKDLVSGVRPDVWGAGSVGCLDELANRGLQGADAVVDAAPQLLGFQGRKPALHEIENEPRRIAFWVMMPNQRST